MEVELVTQSATLLDHRDPVAIMEDLERSARICYKSEGKICTGSAEKLIKKCISRGHESVIEHESLTANIVTNRAIANEIVRHRLASYSQESTRYVRYKDKIQFVIPSEIIKKNGRDFSDLLEGYRAVCEGSAAMYKHLLDKGLSPQTARDVLPHGLKTELHMTANLREWRHIYKLRLSKAAHPQIRELFFGLFVQMLDALPVIFEDIPVADDLVEQEPEGAVYQEVIKRRSA